MISQPSTGVRAESFKLVDIRRAPTSDWLPSTSSNPGTPRPGPSPLPSQNGHKSTASSRVASAAASISSVTAPILPSSSSLHDVESSRPASPSSLAQRDHNLSQADADNSHTHETQLPPTDGGLQAWTFLAGAFLVETTCLGPAFSFSVFQEYLLHAPTSPLKHASSVSISAIGTVLTALIYFAPTLLRGVWATYAPWNRSMGFASIAVASAGLLIASFANSVPMLIAFMGVVPGICLGMATINYVVWLPQWFIKRRGLANGLAFAGAGTGGLIFPFIFNATLNSLGFHWTLRVWAACLITLGSLANYLVRPRLPLTNRSSGRPMRARSLRNYFSGLRYLATPLWIFNALSTLAASTAFFSVSFYLATYCTSLGLSTTAATGAVAAFNGASLLGEITIGHACDRFSYSFIMIFIGLVGSLSAALLFGLAQSLTGVIFFVLLYGWAVGSWCATWTPGALDIARLRSMQTATVILSFAFVRGIASLVGPLIAAGLYNPDDAARKVIFGSYGFDHLIIFVSACMAAVSFFSASVELFRKLSFKGTDLAELQEHF